MCQRGLISPPGGKEYSVRMTGAMTRPLRISKVQIVCGDNVSKPGIEALAFTWIDDKGTAKVADQVDHINGVDHNTFGYNSLEPRPSATDNTAFAALDDHARLAYLSSEQVPGVHDPRGFTRDGKLQSLSFHWKINEFSPKSS